MEVSSWWEHRLNSVWVNQRHLEIKSKKNQKVHFPVVVKERYVIISYSRRFKDITFFYTCTRSRSLQSKCQERALIKLIRLKCVRFQLLVHTDVKKQKKTSDDTLYTILLSTATQNGNIDSNELVPQKNNYFSIFWFLGFYGLKGFNVLL